MYYVKAKRGSWRIDEMSIAEDLGGAALAVRYATVIHVNFLARACAAGHLLIEYVSQKPERSGSRPPLARQLLDGTGWSPEVERARITAICRPRNRWFKGKSWWPGPCCQEPVS